MVSAAYWSQHLFELNVGIKSDGDNTVIQSNRNHVGKVGVPPTRDTLDLGRMSSTGTRSVCITARNRQRFRKRRLQSPPRAQKQAGPKHDCSQAATAWGAGWWAVAGRGRVCARSHSRGPACPSRRGDTFSHTSAWYSSTHRFSCSLSICRAAATLPPSSLQWLTVKRLNQVVLSYAGR